MSRSVLIVGGGITGCGTASFCARAGADVTLLERRRIGYPLAVGEPTRW